MQPVLQVTVASQCYINSPQGCISGYCYQQRTSILMPLVAQFLGFMCFSTCWWALLSIFTSVCELFSTLFEMDCAVAGALQPSTHATTVSGILWWSMFNNSHLKCILLILLLFLVVVVVYVGLHCCSNSNSCPFDLAVKL